MLVIVTEVIAEIRIEAVDASPFRALYDAASSQKALYSSADMSFSSYIMADHQHCILA